MGRVKQTHCQRGHEFAGDNVITGSNGYRRCKTCTRAAEKRHKTTEKAIATRRAWRQRPERKAYDAAYARSEQGKIIAARSRKQSRQEAFERLADIKIERGCIDCGYKAHPAALHFDHVRGEKTSNISRMYDSPWEVVEAEIAKCDVRCANCHAIVTFNRKRGDAWAS